MMKIGYLTIKRPFSRGRGVGGMRPSEIRETKESFLRALVISIVLAILTNTLSLFWVIGCEAWFADSYYAPPPYYDEKTRRNQVNTTVYIGGGKPLSTSSHEQCFQQTVKESEHIDSLNAENILQHIIQTLSRFLKSIFEHLF